MSKSGIDKKVLANLETISAVLEKLSLLPAASLSQEQATKNAAEDYSLQITKSTQRAIKWGTGAGAGASIVTVVGGYLGKANDLVIVAAIIGAAIIIAAGIFGLARVMDGDVRGRASISTESVRARGEVAKTLLELLSNPSESATHSDAVLREDQILFGLAFADKLTVTTSDGVHGVNGARWSSGQQLELRLTGGDWVRTESISAFSAK